MSDDKENNVINMADKSNDENHVTPHSNLKLNYDDGYFKDVDGSITIGVSREDGEFYIKKTSVARLKLTEIIVACEIMKARAIERLTSGETYSED